MPHDSPSKAGHCPRGPTTVSGLEPKPLDASVGVLAPLCPALWPGILGPALPTHHQAAFPPTGTLSLGLSAVTRLQPRSEGRSSPLLAALCRPPGPLPCSLARQSSRPPGSHAAPSLGHRGGAG